MYLDPRYSSIAELAEKYNLDPGFVEKILSMPFDEVVGLINRWAGNRPEEVSPEVLFQKMCNQLRIIQLEVDEAKNNLDNCNFSGLRDDIADIKFTAAGLAHWAMVANSTSDEIEVCLSNLTKFDDSAAAAEKSCQKYIRAGLVVHIQSMSLPVGNSGDTVQKFAIISSKDQVDNHGKSFPEGKWLKADKFIEPIYLDADKHALKGVVFTPEVPEKTDATDRQVDYLEVYRKAVDLDVDRIFDENPDAETCRAAVKKYSLDLLSIRETPV